ncbi:sensor histidine kinase [Haloplanus sp. C73]|uniref:sensor histidine kinase n=1 Tax=Haloplanus sp. C73 TaxID=3421641 RepID=UPI003EBD2912
MTVPSFDRAASAALVVAFAVVLTVGCVSLGGWRWPTAAVAPIGVAAALLLLVGGWLLRCDLDDGVALRVPLTTGVGMLGFGSFGVVVAVDFLSMAGSQATLVVLHFVSAGSAVGVLVGLFAAQQATTIRTLRAREADLRQSRDEYLDLFDGIGDTVLVHDTRGRIIAANDTALDQLGYDHSRLVGHRIDVVEDDAAADRPDPDERLVYEAIHTTADGDCLPVEVSASVVRYAGSPAVLSVARDVSRRRASEREVARKRDQLRALNRVLRHDIRNDMQIVLGQAQALETHVDDAGATRLQTILDTGKHVVELTRRSRHLARTVAGDDELPVDPVSLPAVLRSELDRRRQAFPHATISLDGDVPHVTVRANDLLSSVFRNLLNNAVQHNDRDAPTVAVSVDVTDDTAIVRIADDGPGIDADRAVFGKGKRGLDSDGTGLGLYLVGALVEQYGGDVWFEDNDPRGAVAVVELPLASG